jgi:predicted TPR repeat methyltransferase
MTDVHIAQRSLLDAQILCRIGKLDEAARLFRDYLRVDPRHFASLHWLGLIYFQNRQFEKAEATMAKALQVQPAFLDGLRIRGLSLLQLNRCAQAITCFERALALRPNHIEVLVNLGTAFLETGRPEDALERFNHALALDPDNATGWNNLGNALVALEQFEDAVQAYERALAIQPNLETARRNRFLVRLKLGTVERIADFALREMFDDVADTFDAMMVGGLSYCGHTHVRDLAGRVLPRGSGWRILDLGCGTGLVGEAFKDMARSGRLDGLDLAPRMIETARARGIYDSLILGDLETVLAAPGPAYDLIVSADTMIYLGDLAPAFSGVANRLEKGGYYLFACEAKTGTGWAFTASNRFAHSKCYLREEAARAGLSFIALSENTLRLEKAAPVAGFAIALRKN